MEGGATPHSLHLTHMVVHLIYGRVSGAAISKWEVRCIAVPGALENLLCASISKGRVR